MLKSNIKPQSLNASRGFTSAMKQDRNHDFILVAYKCNQCNGVFVVKQNLRTWQESLQCKCGNQIAVTKHHHARGKCKKCLSPFYNMIVINDLRRIRCRACLGEIDLFIGRDGRLTS